MKARTKLVPRRLTALGLAERSAWRRQAQLQLQRTARVVVDTQFGCRAPGDASVPSRRSRPTSVRRRCRASTCSLATPVRRSQTWIGRRCRRAVATRRPSGLMAAATHDVVVLAVGRDLLAGGHVPHAWTSPCRRCRSDSSSLPSGREAQRADQRALVLERCACSARSAVPEPDLAVPAARRDRCRRSGETASDLHLVLVARQRGDLLAVAHRPQPQRSCRSCP